MRQSAGISLRSWIVYLVVAAGLGTLLVASAAGWLSWREQKAQIGLSFLATSRAVIGAVDRELDQAVALARGLAVSRCLAEGDTDCFDREARSALDPYGYALVLNPADSGRQLLNTQVPLGVTLPNISIDDSWIEPRTLAGSVAVKTLRRSFVSSLWVTIVQVPVRVADELRYVISIVIPSATFQQILDEQRLPLGWNAVVLDGDWTIVGRLISPEKFVGRKGATRELQHTPEPDSIYETHVLEGDWSLSARSRSSRYGWTAAVSMPEAEMLPTMLRPMLSAVLGGFAVAAAAIGVVMFFAARLMRGIRQLAKTAVALGSGEAVTLPPLPVRELTLVGEGMQEAATKLGDNTRLLEARIEEVTKELAREAEERRQSEAALAHAQRLEALGKLTGGVAHDFNNLLSIIMGTHELIERRTDNEEIRRLVRVAQRGASRAARLVETLLAFARKQPLRPQTANPNALIKEFAPVLKGALGDTIELQLVLSPTVHPCNVDPAQFQSALLNLITNSAVAMSQGGRVTIETENVDLAAAQELMAELPVGDYVRITVSDTGTGMPADVVARAFEPFFTTKDIGKGTGLGLSQLYGFAKQSGGHAELTSEPGVGTTVRLYLPRSMVPQNEIAATPPSSVLAGAGHGTNVLVVDDDSEVRAVTAETLRELGYHVSEAANGPQALAMVAAGEKVDVVLTDYAMPQGMNGRQLSQRLAAFKPDIKVVVISGNRMDFVEDAGEVLVLQKPIRQTDLHQAIQSVLER
jgi:signal transduction histidine kinase